MRIAYVVPARGEELSVNLRAPTEHGQVLAIPALDRVGSLLQRNRHLFDSIHLTGVGKSLAELRGLARREVLAAATRYLHEAGAAAPAISSDAWILAGHQPELFHPGVWFKNFLLNQLARKHGALPLNLVVDTDTAKPAILHVPDEGRLTRVVYDRSVLETPYEERTVLDETAFADLPARLEPIVRKWGFEPMLPGYWREVMRQASRTPLLGERFAAARRAVECRWGCVQYEVPMSLVCQSEAFAWFACSILARLLTFHDAHNQILRDYRREHGIRSRHHPVSDLAVEGEWLETPFWAWRRGQPRRGKLFVRRTRDAWTLKVGGEEGPLLPGADLAETVAAWRALESQGIKIRSRALTTTMFARLFLADLFIHGLGGGIYDEVTDRIIERYFTMPAPAFLVLSATLLLPLPRFPAAAEQARDKARQLRDLTYNPDRFLTSHQHDLQRTEKQTWIRRDGATHAERAERFDRIRAANTQLRPFVEPQIEHVRADLQELRTQIRRHKTATRRDYAFCLYPEEMLRTFYANQV